MLLCLTIPGLAFALNSNIEFSLGFGSGDMTVPGTPAKGDVDSLELNLFYTHFLQGLETDDTPYGAREFLQHPSSIGGGFQKYELEIVDGTGDTIDYNVDGIGFGGMYYTSSEPNATGIGLTYVSYDMEMVWTLSGIPYPTDVDETSIILSLNQYVAEGARIELGYRMADMKTGAVSHDATILTIGASALIDNLWISGYLEDGEDDWPTGYTDDDISGLGVVIGAYINQSTGLFFSYSNRETDDGTSTLDETDISFIGDYYLNEKTHIAGTLTLHEEDDPTFAEIEETIIGVQGGFFF
jgi:hypothetical protein